MLALTTHVETTYSIAFTARSGSTEICNILAKLGLGAPTEYFQRPFVQDSEKVAIAGGFNSAFADFVARNSVGGVFGSKMSHDQRAQIEGEIRACNPKVTGLSDYLPNHRWIWLKRRDKVAQAVSLCRAETSGIWHELEGDDPLGRSEFGYDFLFLLSRLEMLCINDLTWELYFDEHHEIPLIVYYEDFFAHPKTHLVQIIEFLGLDPISYKLTDVLVPTLRVLRNECDTAMRERFVADLLDVGAPDWRGRHGKDLEVWEAFFFKMGWRMNSSQGE